MSPSTEAPKDTVFARSEQTPGWFKLGGDAHTMLSDVDNVLR